MPKKPGIYGPDDPEVADIMNVMRGVYAQQEQERGKVGPRKDDGSLETAAWNAVVMGHPNRFEDMRETTEFVRRVGSQMQQSGHIQAKAAKYANTMLAGLLKFLWSTQNLMYLDPDFARGQTGAVMVLVEEINRNWAPPTKQPWFAAVKGFPQKVDRGLKMIDEKTYETVYDVLKPTIKGFADEAVKALDNVEKSHADALPGAAAFVSGVLIEKNTFSPLDGSVPEDIGEAMTKAFHTVEHDNERRYFPYLTKGFQSVREQERDELERWRDEDR